MGIIWLDSLFTTLWWTWNFWWAGSPLLINEEWDYDPNAEPDAFLKDREKADLSWNYLRPFFRSRGYILYLNRFRGENMPMLWSPDPAGPPSCTAPAHPYARRAFTNDDEITFFTVSGREASTELQIIRMLNTKSARKDHRNHTIPVLEFISFGPDWVFVVMPRWPSHIFFHDFGTIAECFQCIEALLEAFDFLHEHKIEHNDVLAQNAGINVITNDNAWYLEGLRDPLRVRFALYDFGHSLIHSVEGRWSTKEMNQVGRMFNIPFRHLQAQIPDFGLLLNDLQRSEEEEGVRLTARLALQRFQEIKLSLTTEQMQSPVHDRVWDRKRGQAVSKMDRPQQLPSNFVKWTEV
ncbi:hypothetical protein H0H93_006004 [Arthromyces matolae]|nr:hypothetical protein H0H93_006004 [Arthromyces matolae]